MPVQSDEPEDYKAKYKQLKRKMKLLIYENECFQEELRKAQRALLRVRRDKSFLLDRLLQYQRNPDSSSDSDQTEESDQDNDAKTDNKRKRLSVEGSTSNPPSNPSSVTKPAAKKKKTNSNSSITAAKGGKQTGKQVGSEKSVASSGGNVQPNVVRKLGGVSSGQTSNLGVSASGIVSSITDGQLSREEVERRLAARQPMNDFSTTVSLTLPNQLFSDNIMEGDFMEEEVETSPSNFDEEITVDYD